jgi:hypothetical protein
MPILVRDAWTSERVNGSCDPRSNELPQMRSVIENIPENIKLHGLTTKLQSFPHIFLSIRCAPIKRVGIVIAANAAERTHVYSSG